MHNHAVGCMFMLVRVFVHMFTSAAVGPSADRPHLRYLRGADRPLETKSLSVVGFATVGGVFLTECSVCVGVVRVLSRARSRAFLDSSAAACVHACVRARVRAHGLSRRSSLCVRFCRSSATLRRDRAVRNLSEKIVCVSDLRLCEFLPERACNLFRMGLRYDSSSE